MSTDDPFDRLAHREAELGEVAARGRRRSLVIMVVLFVPILVLMMLLNRDLSVAEVITFMVPVAVASFWYSWRKWHRHPEDTQSIAFVGLDKQSRRSAYRSMWRGTRVDDAVVLTMIESMHDHLRRSVALVVAVVVAVAVMGVALVQSGGGGAGATRVSIVIGVGAISAIFLQVWMIRRAGEVIDRSRGGARVGGEQPKI